MWNSEVEIKTTSEDLLAIIEGGCRCRGDTGAAVDRHRSSPGDGLREAGVTFNRNDSARSMPDDSTIRFEGSDDTIRFKGSVTFSETLFSLVTVISANELRHVSTFIACQRQKQNCTRSSSNFN